MTFDCSNLETALLEEADTIALSARKAQADGGPIKARRGRPSPRHLCGVMNLEVKLKLLASVRAEIQLSASQAGPGAAAAAATSDSVVLQIQTDLAALDVLTRTRGQRRLPEATNSATQRYSIEQQRLLLSNLREHVLDELIGLRMEERLKRQRAVGAYLSEMAEIEEDLSRYSVLRRQLSSPAPVEAPVRRRSAAAEVAELVPDATPALPPPTAARPASSVGAMPTEQLSISYFTRSGRPLGIPRLPHGSIPALSPPVIVVRARAGRRARRAEGFQMCFAPELLGHGAQISATIH